MCGSRDTAVANHPPPSPQTILRKSMLGATGAKQDLLWHLTSRFRPFQISNFNLFSCVIVSLLLLFVVNCYCYCLAPLLSLGGFKTTTAVFAFSKATSSREKKTEEESDRENCLWVCLHSITGSVIMFTDFLISMVERARGERWAKKTVTTIERYTNKQTNNWTIKVISNQELRLQKTSQYWHFFCHFCQISVYILSSKKRIAPLMKKTVYTTVKLGNRLGIRTAVVFRSPIRELRRNEKEE